MTYVPGHSTSRAASMTRHVGVHPHLGFIEFASVDFFFFFECVRPIRATEVAFLDECIFVLCFGGEKN